MNSKLMLSHQMQLLLLQRRRHQSRRLLNNKLNKNNQNNKKPQRFNKLNKLKLKLLSRKLQLQRRMQENPSHLDQLSEPSCHQFRVLSAEEREENP